MEEIKTTTHKLGGIEMKLNELKAELKEIEKGCGKKWIDEESQDWNCGIRDEPLNVTNRNVKWFQLCPTCQAKIEYLKKGISACEEILNSQEKVSEVVSSNIEKSPVQTLQIIKEALTKVIEDTDAVKLSVYSLKILPVVDKLIKQALSQRNKEMKVKLDKWYSSWKKDKTQEFWRDDFEELKQQLTTKEEGNKK